MRYTSKATAILFSTILLLSGLCRGGIDGPTYNEVMSLIEERQFDSADVMISLLQHQHPQDPDVAVLKINRLFCAARESGMELTPEKPSHGHYLELADSAGQPAGYLVESIVINYDSLPSVFAALAEAVERFPNRLDIHFGRVHVAESAKLYDIMTESLLLILEQGRRNNYQWLWSFSEPLADDNPREFVLENVQSRFNVLFYEDFPHADSLAIVLAHAQAEHFPESVYGYANLGSVFSTMQECDSGTYYHEAALTIDPDDCIVKVNLGKTAYDCGRKGEAKSWYEKILEDCDDPQLRVHAILQLDTLDWK